MNTLGLIKYKLCNYEEAYAALIEVFDINTSQKWIRYGSYDNLKESYYYLDSACITMGDRYRLLDNGVNEAFLAEQDQIVDLQEAYRIRNMIYQGDQIIEKENLTAPLQMNTIIYR